MALVCLLEDMTHLIKTASIHYNLWELQFAWLHTVSQGMRLTITYKYQKNPCLFRSKNFVQK